MRNRLTVLSVVALATLACAWTPDGHATAVYGYPLAARCPAAGVADRVDRWGMYACNCTSYVAWALQANGQRIDWFEPGRMDARNWPQVAREESIPVGRAPRVGAVAVWPKVEPPFGHVAYVTKLDADGTFDVAEYNFRPALHGRRFEFDRRREVDPSGVVFIYVPQRG
jgi:surface antigen